MTRQPGLLKERRRIHHQRPPRRTRRVTFCGFGSFSEFSPCVACCRFVEEDWQLAWGARKRKRSRRGRRASASPLQSLYCCPSSRNSRSCCLWYPLCWSHTRLCRWLHRRWWRRFRWCRHLRPQQFRLCQRCLGARPQFQRCRGSVGLERKRCQQWVAEASERKRCPESSEKMVAAHKQRMTTQFVCVTQAMRTCTRTILVVVNCSLDCRLFFCHAVTLQCAM